MEAKGVVGASSPKWVSVKDQIPEKHQAVLCIGTKGGMFLANGSREYYAENGKIWIDGQGWRKFTHWMAIPEQTKEVLE